MGMGIGVKWRRNDFNEGRNNLDLDPKNRTGNSLPASNEVSMRSH